MANLLYYPYINLPKTDWAARALLYYDSIGAIVPMQYFYEPELYDPFMRELIDNELIETINPMDVVERPQDVTKIFIDYMEYEVDKRIERRKWLFHNQDYAPVHQDKFAFSNKCVLLHDNKFDNDLFRYLINIGLATQKNDNWYLVEETTASELMTYLASIVGDKLQYLPATDKIDHSFSNIYINNDDIEVKVKQYKRDLILKELIPSPREIDITKLRRFKNRYYHLLESFRNKVELLVLNRNIAPESEAFQITLKEMKEHKMELTARMNEGRLGDIIFGTICGTIAAGAAFLASPALGGTAGLLNAIYSAIQIGKAKNVQDQTGLKYLALTDKKIRNIKKASL